MKQRDLFFNPKRLFEELCSEDQLLTAYKSVKKNKGSAGIDGVSLKDFETKLNEELGQLQKELESWTYKPSPVRQVEIPKPGNKKEKRKLGVPTVRDRIVQTAIKQLLEPLLDPTFSDHSYGFRPGRNQRQAVESARDIVVSGKEWCVDIDLAQFFDRVPQDRLMTRLSKLIADKRIVRLVGMSLRSGIMNNGVYSATPEGTTQGSPLSPLLSNLVLDELDDFLEKRDFSFCRFADDLNAYVGSKKAAVRLMENLTTFIERKLKLKVNRDKSQVARSQLVKFLGMTIISGTVAIAPVSIDRAMAKVRELSSRGTSETLSQTIDNFNQWYRGWSNYYKMTQYPAQLGKIEAHFRRRIRARIIDQHKSRRNLFRKLQTRGVANLRARTVFSNRKRWALSKTIAMSKGYPNVWFEEQGLYTISDEKLEWWFERNVWIKFT